MADSDLLSRQVDEVEVLSSPWKMVLSPPGTCVLNVGHKALVSMYPDDGAVSFTVHEHRNLEAARAALRGDGSAASLAGISGRVRLPEVRVSGEAVSLAFHLSHDYPLACPALRVECASATRQVLDELNVKLQEHAEACSGEESLLVCLDLLQTTVLDLIATGELRAEAPADEVSRPSAAVGPFVLKQAVVWFHHIKSPKKRKSMADWAHELGLGGYAKLGYPGVMIVEGEAGDVDDFLGRVRGQSWKAMAVRGEAETPCEGGADLDVCRKLPRAFSELGEKDLGVLGEHCRAAGLESLFLTALKL